MKLTRRQIYIFKTSNEIKSSLASISFKKPQQTVYTSKSISTFDQRWEESRNTGKTELLTNHKVRASDETESECRAFRFWIVQIAASLDHVTALLPASSSAYPYCMSASIYPQLAYCLEEPFSLTSGFSPFFFPQGLFLFILCMVYNYDSLSKKLQRVAVIDFFKCLLCRL